MAKSNVENIANMADEVLDSLKENTKKTLEEIGIPVNEAVKSMISQIGSLEESIVNSTTNITNEAGAYISFISGEQGIGTITGQEYGKAEEAIQSAKDETEELTKATEDLNNALTQELGATSAAEQKIAEYEKQLTAAKASTSALARKLDSAETALKDAEYEKQKSQLAFNTAKSVLAGDFKKGDKYTLKKGT